MLRGGGPRRCGWRGGRVSVLSYSDALLDALNSKPEYDASNIIREYLNDDENPDEYVNFVPNSLFYDINTFINTYKDKNNLILSMKIQSLQSKFNDLKLFIYDLNTHNIKIDAIVLQETWNIKYPDFLILPGFQQIVYHTRNNNNNGGGVGIYVHEGLNFRVNTNPVVNISKIFESISIDILYPYGILTLSSIYRSPNAPINTTPAQAMESFLTKFDSFLNNISLTKKNS
jgi:hypothetical protein